MTLTSKQDTGASPVGTLPVTGYYLIREIQRHIPFQIETDHMWIYPVTSEVAHLGVVIGHIQKATQFGLCFHPHPQNFTAAKLKMLMALHQL